jgi:hypothetical protein
LVVSRPKRERRGGGAEGSGEFDDSSGIERRFELFESLMGAEKESQFGSESGKKSRASLNTHEELIPVQSSLSSSHQALLESQSTFRDVDRWRVLDLEESFLSFLVGVLGWCDFEISRSRSDGFRFFDWWIRDSTVDVEFDLVVL